MMEVGTLKELDVKPGDVVELVCSDAFKGHTYTIQEDTRVLDNDGSGHYYGFVRDDISFPRTWRIISRVSDNPKTWSELTDAEKGALLLAELRGETIESSHNRGKKWKDNPNKLWHERHSYRIKTEPKRETVNLAVWQTDGHFYEEIGTIDMIDGEPDCDSIRIEKL